MRQTSKRARRSRALMIVIFVLLAALVIWGLTALLGRLLHYGTNATVSAKDHEQLTPIEPSAVDKTEEIPENTYDPSCFYMDGGFLRYESDTITSQVGIDVSAHQQEIDWQRVADSGVQFVILRVGYRGYTEGAIQEDAYFTQNLEGAIDAGLDVGVYFFSQAIDEQEAREEARFVLDKIRGYALTGPVVFDWEALGKSEARTYGLDTDTLCRCALAFCELVEEAGYTPMIYLTSYAGYVKYDLSRVMDYPFWFAEYDKAAPTFYYHFQMWQYTSKGKVDGIEGRVDMNITYE